MAVQRDKVIASAEKLVAKGKIEPAIKEYERLLDDNPSDVNTLNRIGDLWVRINRNDEAVKTFGKIADHYARDGFFLKAIAIYKKINKLDPSKLDIYARLADLYAKQGLAMEAKSQYQVLADYYLKHGDPANALNTYRKISELDPNSINVHVKLADLHSQVGQTAEALKEYDRVGRMLLKRGMLDEAVQVFKKALKIDAKNVELVESLVTALIEAKDLNNAQAIVEQALQTNKEHPRLLALWGKILLAKGDAPSAMKALQRGLAADENDPLVRESLADLYLRQNNADSGLEMIVPLVEKAVSRGDRGTAVDMLQRVLRVDQGHTPTLERLVALYTRLNEETNILSSMNSLAEAHISRGEHEKAAAVLDRLIQREPQNAQHRNKLQFVRSHLGGAEAAAPPIRPKTVDLPVPMEVQEPEPTFDESPEISLGDSGPAIDLDFSPEAPAAPTPAIIPAVELAAMESDVEGGEDIDFITEHLTEAEVFAKYGLAEKAIEHLRAVIERSPKHGPAYDRLFRIQLDEGNVDEARATATEYIGILEEKGDSAGVDAVRNEFISSGHALTAPTRKLAPAPSEKKAPEPPAAVESSVDLDAGLPPLEIEMELEEPAAEEAPPAEIEEIETAPEPAAEEAPAEVDEIEIAAESEQETKLDETPAAAEEPFYGVEALGTTAAEPSAEELAEVDFYLEQELFDEARSRLDNLATAYPDHSDLEALRERIEAAAAAPPPPKPATPPEPAPAPQPKAPPPPPSRPPILSRDEIESEILSALPDDDEELIPAPAPPPPPAAPPPPPPPMAATPVQEENLFADEDDFFDLAAELESELDGDEVVSLSEEEQSLEEIFKEFKKGVEQQLDSEDYDTHYNLGIAYKEMGLIDEAIGEFQLASKDPKRAVECASMLGLCFLEKGMPQLAIKWYRKGLEMPEITEDEHIGLLYDLAAAQVEMGDTESAQKAFMEVYGINSNYRDVVSRIKQLEDARK
ncbi:MAG TPA: tetratricopeptide repeat protein [Thermoanaerobaculia bacterium]|nr:tetratricopeptide repeat protein [Thermoanaerobaculia bacterium]